MQWHRGDYAGDHYWNTWYTCGPEYLGDGFPRLFRLVVRAAGTLRVHVKKNAIIAYACDRACEYIAMRRTTMMAMIIQKGSVSDPPDDDDYSDDLVDIDDCDDGDGGHAVWNDCGGTAGHGDDNEDMTDGMLIAK